MLVIILAVDLFNVAARVSLYEATPARLSILRDPREGLGEQAQALLKSQQRARAVLRIWQMLLRLGTLGLALQILLLPGASQDVVVSPAVYWGLALLIGILMAWLEWVVGEAAANNPEVWLLRLVGYIRTVAFIGLPLAAVPLAITRQVSGEEDNPNRVTEEELMTIVDAGQQEGVLEQDERKMIISVIELGDTLAREIMVPRIDVLALEVTTPLRSAVDALLDSGYSRVPVFEETIDNVLGLLYAKDLLNAWRLDAPPESLAGMLRPAYFVPEAKKVDELLQEMQTRRVHMAVVVDEYGGVAGLVTLEDIVEEIIGEIRDEYDQREEAFSQQVGPDEYLCSGRMPLDEFNELMNIDLPDEEADTLGGFIYSQIGRVPVGGESLRIADLLLTVEQVARRRIRLVRASRSAPPAETSEEAAHAKS